MLISLNKFIFNKDTTPMILKPFISVCVAIYNVDKYLDKCLKSLEEQKIQNI